MSDVNIIIDWRAFIGRPRKSFRDFYDNLDWRYGPQVSWDVPHKIYRSLTPMDVNNMPVPHQVVPKLSSHYVEEDAPLETEIFYRVGEMRVGGELLADKETKIFMKSYTLNVSYKSFERATFSDPVNAPAECTSEVFETLSGEYYCTIEADAPVIPRSRENGLMVIEDKHMNPLGEVWNDWLYTGRGTPTEYLFIWIDDMLFGGYPRYTGRNLLVDTQNLAYSIRDYEPPRKTSNDAYLTCNDTYGCDYEGGIPKLQDWWPDYRDAVVTTNYPDSWHEFWVPRLDTDRDWYDRYWT